MKSSHFRRSVGSSDEGSLVLDTKVRNFDVHRCWKKTVIAPFVTTSSLSRKIE